MSAPAQGGNPKRQQARDAGQERTPQKQMRQAEHEEIAPMADQSEDVQSSSIEDEQLTERTQSMESSLSQESEVDPVGDEDIQPPASVPEDDYRLDNEDVTRYRIKENDIPKTPYHAPQIFLAENILKRIEIIQSGALEVKYKKFAFRIYTANIRMLENQTKSRLADPAAECFSLRISGCVRTLREVAKLCVDKYNHHAIEKHEELMEEVRNNPDTFYLIVADEAHWGTTGAAQSDDPNAKKKAYTNLVNSWNDEDFPNVLVLQVTATPYNLLTTNSRIDTSVMCVWEESNGKRVLRALEENEKCSGKTVMLHHVKWNESFEQSIQHGVNQKIKIPQKIDNALDLFLSVGDNGEWKADLESWCEFKLQGVSSEKVTIQTTDGRTLVVREDSTRGTKSRMQGEFQFVPTSSLVQYEERSYLFKMTHCGQDVYLLDTSDERFKLKLNADKTRVVGEPSRTATVDAPYLEGSFVACYNQPLEASEEVDEYASLNHFLNSMGESEQYHRLLRGDNEYTKLCDDVQRGGRKWSVYDILTADYALHVLTISEVRQCKLKRKKLGNVLKGMHLACGDYTQRRDNLIAIFTEQLPPENRTISRIKPELFSLVLSLLEKQTKERFMENLRDLGKEEEGKDIAQDNKDVCSYLVDCLLFLRKPALMELQKQIQFVLREKEKYKELYVEFEKLEFEKRKLFRIEENETCRLVENLVVRKDKGCKELEGPLKIVRMTSDSGDVMYATLCLARKLAFEKDYSFEILRDYGDFPVWKEYVHEPEAATYRIKQILQRQRCGEVTNDQSCFCNDYKPTPDLTCAVCGHFHTKVQNYVDLNRLPCLLIMVEKGRMGDTFPESFNTMDLRASTEARKQPILSTLVQELGRLCRYVRKSEKKNLPYALLGKGLAGTITLNRNIYAAFYAGYSKGKLDNYIGAGNTANKKHTDHLNTEKHMNRILFEAEPQIGKTGVYLCLISLLRKKIEGKNQEEEVLEEGQEEEEKEEEVTQESEGQAIELEEDWQYPYWKDMDVKRPVLKKKINNGKYVSVYGQYIFGESPKAYPSKQSPSESSSISVRKVQVFKFRTNRKITDDLLARQPVSGKAKHFDNIEVEGARVRFSVPMLHCYQPLVAKLTSSDLPQLNQPEKETLRTWIFTPSCGRSKTAYLNYDYAMVDSQGSSVRYVHVVVVRPKEYQAYCREWGTTHAVVCLPDTLPQAGDVGPGGGGIGYARLFIQLLAKKFALPAVFMLDDNILGCTEVKITEDQQLYQTDDGKHQLVSVSLYSCLHHMEQQLYGEKDQPPKESGTFDAYKDIAPTTQESFTGPWSRYAIIGMLRHSKYVYGYKKPFTRAHVMAAVLINIKAVTERGLHYKPQQVWEDLDMNNQCDDAGLWVVKYKRFVLHKFSMQDTLPKAFVWNETTLMTRERPSSGTNYIDILESHINKGYNLTKIHAVPSEPNNTICDSVKTLTDSLILNKDQDDYHLVAIQDEGLGELALVTKLDEACMRSQNRILLLLPASTCIASDLMTKESFRKLLKEVIQEDFDIKCFTSVDVMQEGVNLVLVDIKVSGEPQREKTRDSNQGTTRQTKRPSALNDQPNRNQETQRPIDLTNEEDTSSNASVEDIFPHSPSILQGSLSASRKGENVIDLTEEDDVMATTQSTSNKTQGMGRCATCNVKDRCNNIIGNLDIEWIKDTFKITSHLTPQSKICDACMSYVTVREAFFARRESNTLVKSSPVENKPAAHDENADYDSQEIPARQRKRKKPMVIASPESQEVKDINRVKPDLEGLESPAKMQKSVRRQLMPESSEGTETKPSVSPASPVASSSVVRQGTTSPIANTNGVPQRTVSPIPSTSGVGRGSTAPLANLAAAVDCSSLAKGDHKESYTCIFCKEKFDVESDFDMHKKKEYARFMAAGSISFDED